MPNIDIEAYSSIMWCEGCRHKNYKPFSEDWNYYCLDCNQSDSRKNNDNFESDSFDKQIENKD